MIKIIKKIVIFLTFFEKQTIYKKEIIMNIQQKIKMAVDYLNKHHNKRIVDVYYITFKNERECYAYYNRTKKLININLEFFENVDFDYIIQTNMKMQQPYMIKNCETIEDLIFWNVAHEYNHHNDLENINKHNNKFYKETEELYKEIKKLNF